MKDIALTTSTIMALREVELETGKDACISASTFFVALRGDREALLRTAMILEHVGWIHFDLGMFRLTEKGRKVADEMINKLHRKAMEG